MIFCQTNRKLQIVLEFELMRHCLYHHLQLQNLLVYFRVLYTVNKCLFLFDRYKDCGTEEETLTV